MLLKKILKARRTWCGKAIRHSLVSHNFWLAELSMYRVGLECKFSLDEHPKYFKKNKWSTIRQVLNIGGAARGNEEG